MRRRRLLTYATVAVVLIGGVALAMLLVTGALPVRSDDHITPASPTTSAPVRTTVASPPKHAAPAEVLTAYLLALRSGDCQSSRALTTRAFGEPCVTVKAYTPLKGLSNSGDDEAEFATTLTTAGGGAMMPDGLHTRFYILDRQADGAWRLVSAGSGP